MTNLFTTDILLIILTLFFGSLFVTYYLIPKIINVVNHKELMDSPNQRSSHIQLTPTFGGISFFVILVFTLFFVNIFDSLDISMNIVVALTILLFTGLKDDLVVISSTSKLLGQLAAVVIFLFQTTYYEIDLHGFLGIHEIQGFLGFFFTTFIMLSIINAFNLIDGIDGLAGSIAVIVLLFFGVIFYNIEHYFFTFICVALIGSLIAFLKFNLSDKKKIFMGDTGSLIIGFVVAIMAVNFLSLSSGNLNKLTILPQNSIMVIAAILVVPLFDTLRVIILRISNKKHPLQPDKNHIHHLLLDLGNSHKKSSVLIAVFSVIFSIVFLYLSTQINDFWILLSLFVGSFFIFYGLFFQIAAQRK